MKFKIEIDKGSGFCYGVIRAIDMCEANLAKGTELYSLGSIVHNDSELNRLQNKGLRITDASGMENMKEGTVLIRAHGEPPSTYAAANKKGITLIDCTCPVVLRLQSTIRETYEKYCRGTLLEEGENRLPGQIVIFGKKGHAEVNGLVGQVNSDAVVIESENDLDKIDFRRPVYIFSQTTKDPQKFDEICNKIKKRAEKGIHIKNTICHQVVQRHHDLPRFAERHDVIIFVSGLESSNGKVLYELCRKVNPRSYRIGRCEEIKSAWFENCGSVGICGATSTPKWQLDLTKKYINENFQKS
ncbi:MAG: 4-hydroxy-3-methylbut-2-enyl diphosphate reductase [Bacteroidales bacterium]|jgi:4-hydroxy-3-methylbut-2-enyl diphosphate reductase|nr:4-hydroxy-3-methylbut-2-enyl diphosphate reductase [Bacteroidales bacterium]